MFWIYKGKRIRPNDKNLFVHFIIIRLSPIFLSILFIFYHRQLFKLIENKTNYSNTNIQINIPYLLSCLLTALLVCLVAALVYRHYCIDHIKQVLHRQKIARMFLENGWYETTSLQSDSFFKDVNHNQTKEKISSFPKIYYYLKDGFIHIHVEIRMGKYQEQLLKLENKLETGLYCELTDKIFKDSFVEYIFLYDTISNRISIDNVQAENGKLKLMDSIWWAYDSLPHMLIAGGTGGGKTYFILTIIEALLQTNSTIYILDPKNADLADLGTIMPNVYSKKEDMISCLNQFYEEMMTRNETMKSMVGYKTGQNYAYLNLPAHFLIFDEYTSFMEMIGRESINVMSKLKQIVMLGRQSGFFLILACQRPDAKYLGDGIRDNFNFRVALGRMSELGYNMMFGETNKEFFLKPIKGRGYVDVGTSVISEFYTPLVPKDHDFLTSISSLYQNKLDLSASCEAKDADKV